MGKRKYPPKGISQGTNEGNHITSNTGISPDMLLMLREYQEDELPIMKYKHVDGT